MRPLLVLRLTYMADYIGEGGYKHGGSYVDEGNEPHEDNNFRLRPDKRYLAYVQPPSIDLNRLDKGKRYKKGDSKSGVDIVFIARLDGVGQVVVGFYRNATVYHKYFDRKYKQSFVAFANKKVTIPELDRHRYVVPKGKGFPGRSNIWYGDCGSTQVNNFVLSLRKLIEGYSSGKVKATKKLRKKPAGHRRETDPDLIAQVEQIACKSVIHHFKIRGYNIDSVE